MVPRLVVLLLALSFSGCVSDASDAGADDGLVDETAALVPVAIDESYDLTSGMAERSWSFTIAENATTALISFVLAPLDPLVLRGEGDDCLEYAIVREFEGGSSRTTGSRGQCNSAGNIVVGVEVAGALENDDLLTWSEDLPLGSYSISFSSAPQVAQLVVSVDVQY